MDRFALLTPLRNTYFVMRHGKSLANLEGRIVSDPEVGVSAYGLTGEGRAQVAAAVGEAARRQHLDATTVIVTSDFARARQSAEIAGTVLGSKEIILTPKLRERSFGVLKEQPDSNYLRVWAADALDSSQKQNGVESTREVLERAVSLLADLEEKYDGRTILLVSHGDVLQILQTAFEGIEPGAHRLVTHLETAQIRKLPRTY